MITPFLQRIPKRRLLVGWLLVLHLVLALGAESPVGRSLLIVHFGLFLLWQPFVGARLVVPKPYLLLFGMLLVAFISLGWWALMLWMMLLAGVVGGRVFFDAPWRVRIFYLLVLGDLISALLLLALPTAIVGTASSVTALRTISLYGLPALLGLFMVFFPLREDNTLRRADTVDLVYSLFILLLLAVLVSGSIAVMFVRQLQYFEAVLITLVTMAAVLLALALVWSPRFGFSGLAALLSRYMLADSLPFDRLLRDLTDSARLGTEPGPFVQRVGERSQLYLNWVNGAQWRLHEGASGTWGDCEGSAHVMGGHLLQVTLYATHPMSPTLLWHSRLFVQLLEEYCQAMIRARKLHEMSYIEAVHQTGARLTHDVKNLLQSLNTLCAACAAMEPDAERALELHALMQRQLPAISQRLQATLGKLAQPVVEMSLLGPVKGWWSQLTARYEGRGVAMVLAPSAATRTVPCALFDSAAENLLQNALDKRALQADVVIRLDLGVRGKDLLLSVEDSGIPVPAAVADRLGQGFPSAENGLGIGLYQLHQQAAADGYALKLVSNVAGCVRFELSPNSDSSK